MNPPARRCIETGYETAAVLRNVGVGSQILLDLGVREMILLTSTTARLPALEGYGLKIVDRRPIPLEE